MKQKIKLLLAISLNLILTSCNSEDEMVKINDSKQLKSITTTDANKTHLNRYYEYSNELITKVTTESGTIFDYEYDDKNRITRIRNEHYEYYSDGKLSSHPSFNKIVYDLNKIIYQYIANDNGDLATRAELTTDSKGRIIKIFTPDYSCCRGQPESDVTWQYQYDETGNIVKQFSTDISLGDLIIYDNNKNPFYYTFKPINNYLNDYEKNRSIQISIVNNNGISPNNILIINHEGGGKTEYTYEYDEIGFPISATYEFTWPDGTISPGGYTMKYEYY